VRPEDKPTVKELHEQLGTWGYYREQIKLYEQLLDKLNPIQHLHCLNGLGRTHYCLGDIDQAIEYHQKQLELAEETGNLMQQARALYGLGKVYSANLRLMDGIACCKQHLSIAKELGDREEEGLALSGLGHALYRMFVAKGKQSHCQEAIQHLEASLKIANDFGNRSMEIQSLRYLSNTYVEIGQYEEAIASFQYQLEINREIEDRPEISTSLGDIGRTLMMTNESEKAIEFFQESLIIVREIGDREGESGALNGLAVVYCYTLQQYHQAIFYLEQSLEIDQKRSMKHGACIALVNLINCYIGLKDREKVKSYLKLAHAVAAEVDSVDAKGLVIFAEANAHWSQESVWQKLIGLSLAAKGFLIMPPWKSSNGRLAMREAIRIVLTVPAQKVIRSITKSVRKFLSS